MAVEPAGSAYAPAELRDALDEQALIELQGDVRPAEDIALYRAEMAAWPGAGDAAGLAGRRSRDWVRGQRRLPARHPRPAASATGRCRPASCPTPACVPWRSSGWNNNRNVAMLLELMVDRGEVAVAGREGRDRLWDLAERVYPDDDAVPAEEARRIRDERRLRVARHRPGPRAGVPGRAARRRRGRRARGRRGRARDSGGSTRRCSAQPFGGRAALLSPFDRLVFDRKRMAELFEFDYQLEMYKPAAKRRWGYYALPILYGDRLVGKVDATADRRAGVLRVDAVHEDVPFDDGHARRGARRDRGPRPLARAGPGPSPLGVRATPRAGGPSRTRCRRVRSRRRCRRRSPRNPSVRETPGRLVPVHDLQPHPVAAERGGPVQRRLYQQGTHGTVPAPAAAPTSR